MISVAEWQVMRVVWSQEEVTAHMVYDVLEGGLGWSLSTVKTLLGRLVKKGYVDTVKSGRAFIYRACMTEKEAIVQLLLTDLEGTCYRQRGDILLEVVDKVAFTKDQCQHLIQLLQTKKQTSSLTLPCQCMAGQCRCHMSTVEKVSD